MEPTPIRLTILRKGDTNIIDLAEVGSLIPRSETQVDGAFLRDLAAEVMHLVTPGYGRGESQDMQGNLVREPDAVVHDLQRVGGLIFSHLLTEPARKRLRTADPCDLYLRLDEQLIHVPWELCYDGDDFLITKFRVGRQVITGYPIPGTGAAREVIGSLKVLLIADPTESLSQASDEADRLCALLDRISGVDITLLGGKGVRKVPLLAALQAHDIVHFAGHSYYDPDSPSKSGWRLHEGVLTAGELSKLSRPPLLVFSNSCQAGTTAGWEGGYRYEGQAFGIGSAFLLAGVRNYVGTFWVVHDEESVLFAAAFYRSVVSGLSLGEALFQARQEVIRQRGRAGLTWASYMLYGDPAFTPLPAAEKSIRQVALPTEPMAQKEPLPLASDRPTPSETSRSEAVARSPRHWPVRRFVLIGGLAVAALVPLRLFLLRDLPLPGVGDTEVKSKSAHQAGTALQKGPAPLSLPQEKRQPKAVGVMHFKALGADPQLEWIREAIRDTFNSQLSSAADLKVYSKEYIDFLVQKGPATEIEVANQLGIAKMISGSFLAIASKLRIEAHIVDVQSGFLEASDHVEGEQSDFFNLHKQLAFKVMARLNIVVSLAQKDVASVAPPTPSLDTYKLLLEAEGETPVAEPALEDAPHSQGSSRKEDDIHSRISRGRIGVSVVWAEETPLPGLASEEEIRQVLERYRQAYEKKDLTLLDGVYATLTTAQREANVKYFQNTQDLRVMIRDVDIAVRGTEAAVSYTREDQFIDTQTGQTVKLAVRFTKILTRTDGAWKIASGKK